MAKEIAAADAVKAFKGKSIAVRVSKAAKVKGPDGKTRDGFDTKEVPLAAEHVLSAYDYGDRIVITTINGRKHEAATKGDTA